MTDQLCPVKAHFSVQGSYLFSCIFKENTEGSWFTALNKLGHFLIKKLIPSKLSYSQGRLLKQNQRSFIAINTYKKKAG